MAANAHVWPRARALEKRARLPAARPLWAGGWKEGSAASQRGHVPAGTMTRRGGGGATVRWTATGAGSVDADSGVVQSRAGRRAGGQAGGRARMQAGHELAVEQVLGEGVWVSEGVRERCSGGGGRGCACSHTCNALLSFTIPSFMHPPNRAAIPPQRWTSATRLQRPSLRLASAMIRASCANHRHLPSFSMLCKCPLCPGSRERGGRLVGTVEPPNYDVAVLLACPVRACNPIRHLQPHQVRQRRKKERKERKKERKKCQSYTLTPTALVPV